MLEQLAPLQQQDVHVQQVQDWQQQLWSVPPVQGVIQHYSAATIGVFLLTGDET